MERAKDLFCKICNVCNVTVNIFHLFIYNPKPAPGI